MMRHVYWILRAGCIALLAGVIAACAAQPQPEWRIAAADQIAAPTDLVLTVPRDDQEALAEVSADIESRYGVTLVAEWPLASIDVHCLVVRAAAPTDVPDLVDAMGTDSMIRTVQPVQKFATLAPSYSDELFTLQTGLQRINAAEVHSVVTGDRVRVGIIDTGVDFEHPDLADRLALAKDFVGDDADAYTPERHGTAIAGIIAADASNGAGIVGVAPGALLLGLRGCWQDLTDGTGRCSTFSLARALNFAILNKVPILNMSLAGPFDSLLAELIAEARERSIVLIAAAGLAPDANFPASEDGVIAVQAAGIAGGAAVSAPGLDILSTVVGGGYDVFSGNSVAAAHVSGVAALLLEGKQNLGPAQLKVALRRGAKSANEGQLDLVFDTCSALASVASARRQPVCP